MLGNGEGKNIAYFIDMVRRRTIATYPGLGRELLTKVCERLQSGMERTGDWTCRLLQTQAGLDGAEWRSRIRRRVCGGRLWVHSARLGRQFSQYQASVVLALGGLFEVASLGGPCLATWLGTV